MLKVLLKLSLVIFLAVVIATIGNSDPGYILINFNNYVIETSVMVVLLTSFLLFFLFSIASKLLKPVWIWLTPALSSKPDKGLHLTQQGLLYLSNGDWYQAKKLLNRVPQKHRLALTAAIGCAKACYELGQPDGVRQYLDHARTIDQKSGNKNRHHIHIFEAQVQYQYHQYTDSLKALAKVPAAKHSTSYWKLKGRILHDAQQWHQLFSLLPKLRQDKALSEDELVTMEVHCLSALMLNQPLETIEQYWSKIPKKHGENPEIARAKYNALLSIKENQLAFDLAREQIQAGVDSRWALDMIKLKSIDWQIRFNLITKYMGNLDDTNINKALGLIAYQGHELDYANQYLTKVIEANPEDIKVQLLIFELEKRSEKKQSAEQQLLLLAQNLGEGE